MVLLLLTTLGTLDDADGLEVNVHELAHLHHFPLTLEGLLIFNLTPSNASDRRYMNLQVCPRRYKCGSELAGVQTGK